MNRREFLGAALPALMPLSPAQTKAPQTRPVRVGFIGVGSRGTSLLRTALSFPMLKCRQYPTSTRRP
jgi:hypothetical protein